MWLFWHSSGLTSATQSQPFSANAWLHRAEESTHPLSTCWSSTSALKGAACYPLGHSALLACMYQMLLGASPSGRCVLLRSQDENCLCLRVDPKRKQALKRGLQRRALLPHRLALPAHPGPLPQLLLSSSLWLEYLTVLYLSGAGNKKQDRTISSPRKVILNLADRACCRPEHQVDRASSSISKWNECSHKVGLSHLTAMLCWELFDQPCQPDLGALKMKVKLGVWHLGEGREASLQNEQETKGTEV